MRTVIAFREIGRGHQPMKEFCRILNMPSMNVSAYDKINNKLSSAYINPV